ncbi:conserved hypothetical protein [Cupriavidus taiwanensis]|uniref:hypothetical protein n=1 Tax=Cupriavidus taiwanensis TaxID=164546 RepID=UPI000E148FAC|nr:hypothetical protein [Cupriavidus taiwanensis]SOY54128.1 conserved hypothetical protein [Cupriavidus taiwanensis]
MTNSLFTQSAVNSRFGWPKPKRTEEFARLLSQQVGATERVVFQGKTIDIPIIRVPIELPKYRLANGRTASLQSEFLAKNAKIRSDIFSGDPELWDAQESQHNLLLQLAKQADLGRYFEDTGNQQVNPILLDESGFVVNGNRRLATWRELLHKEPGKYDHYQHIDVAVLPHCEEKEIDRLEARLQISKDIRADYSWDAQANMMLAKQKRDGFSNKELAELYDIKETEVEELFDMRSYAEEFLKSRGKPQHWSLVADSEFAFKKMVAARPKIASIGKQQVFKEAAFILIEKPDEAGSRLYEAIPAVLESLDEVKNKLLENFTVGVAEPVDDALTDLFGGGLAAPGEDPRDLPLAKEMQKPENTDAARKIIVEVIESQKQLKKDAKNASYLLECCTKAHAILTAAVKEGLRPESKLEGVLKQLDEITRQADKIRAFVHQNAKH